MQPLRGRRGLDFGRRRDEHVAAVRAQDRELATCRPSGKRCLHPCRAFAPDVASHHRVGRGQLVGGTRFDRASGKQCHGKAFGPLRNGFLVVRGLMAARQQLSHQLVARVRDVLECGGDVHRPGPGHGQVDRVLGEVPDDRQHRVQRLPVQRPAPHRRPHPGDGGRVPGLRATEPAQRRFDEVGGDLRHRQHTRPRPLREVSQVGCDALPQHPAGGCGDVLPAAAGAGQGGPHMGHTFPLSGTERLVTGQEQGKRYKHHEQHWNNP